MLDHTARGSTGLDGIIHALPETRGGGVVPATHRVVVVVHIVLREILCVGGLLARGRSAQDEVADDRLDGEYTLIRETVDMIVDDQYLAMDTCELRGGDSLTGEGFLDIGSDRRDGSGVFFRDCLREWLDEGIYGWTMYRLRQGGFRGRQKRKCTCLG